MQLERVRKNHMDVEWHEYTDENEEAGLHFAISRNMESPVYLQLK